MTDRHLPAIINVHAHPPMPSFLTALRHGAASGPARLGGRTIGEWTPAQSIDTMDAHGIEAMVMSNPLGMAGTSGIAAVALAQRINDEMADVIARHPKRFGAFAMLPLNDIDASLAELTRALDDLKFDGACLLTNINGAYLGEKRLWPLLAELNQRRSVAFVHPTGPAYLSNLSLPFDPALMELMFDGTRSAASIVLSGLRRTYPDVTYIVTHAGGTIPYLVHRFETMAMATAAYGVAMNPEEIRAGFQSLYYDLTASTGSSTLSSMLEMVDTSQLMLGFDDPIRPVGVIDPSRAELAGSRFLSDEDLTAITRTNALRILSQLARRLST